MEKYNLLIQIDNVILDAIGIALSALRIPKMFSEKQVMEKNKELPQFRRNDRVYVCGLGPSFSDVDLEKLDGDIIATNRFLYAANKCLIEPTYCCLFDRAFCEKASDYTEEVVSAYRNTAFVFDGKDREKYEAIPGVATGNSFYAYMWSGRCKASNSFDFSGILPAFGNVVCGAIALAFYCGYKEIILLGCDFNSFASLGPSHCYQEERAGKAISLDYELFVYSFVARIHNELQKYAKAHGIILANATKGSLIEAHPFDFNEMERLYAR